MRLQLKFLVDLGSTESGGSVFMNDWADKALKRIEDRRINQRNQDEVFLEKQRIKRAQGFPLWLEVRKHVEANCSDFNLKAGTQMLVFEVTPDSELLVRASIDGSTRTLHANFKDSTGELSFFCGAHSGHWILEATTDGKAQFIGSSRTSSTEQVAEQMLTSLV